MGHRTKTLGAPQRAEVIDQCAKELARALREEYITDPQGRRIRSKHVALREKDGEQLPLWADIRTADRGHMGLAFQQRRRQIFGDCHQLKADVDSYNENYNVGEQIQISFDFTNDLEEAEIANTIRRSSSPERPPPSSQSRVSA